jgi:hypothetical protein
MSNAAPGDYDDGSGKRRWWDGGQWTGVYEAAQVVTATRLASQATTISPDQKQPILAGAVTQWAANGWTVNFVNAHQAVLKRIRRMGWFWNTVAVLLTGGLWLIYVIYRALNRLTDTAVLAVDEFGNIRRIQ